jgi:hypothetical protein
MVNGSIIAAFCRKPLARARRLESVKIVANDPWHVDLVLYRKPRSGRLHLNRHGARSRSHTSLKAERREREPWLLVASCALNELSAKQIAGIYSKRMQIAQSFRDLKCERFGCAFYYSLTRKQERIAMLLLIHALATFVAWLCALSQQTFDAQVQYGGVISSRRRHHYSQLRMGWEALRKGDATRSIAVLRSTFTHPPSSFLGELALPS